MPDARDARNSIYGSRQLMSFRGNLILENSSEGRKIREKAIKNNQSWALLIKVPIFDNG
jgi:hypothetical protein